MKKSVSIKKLIYSLLIFYAVTLFNSNTAYAEEIPVLTWERGQVQNVVLGQGDTSGSWDLYLKSNNGQRLKASKSFANEGNYYVYSLSIPKDFPISGYVIEAVNVTGEIKQVAGVQVVEKISTEITRTPFELFLVLIGISFFLYLLNFSKNRKISLYELDSNAEQQNKFQNVILNKELNFKQLTIRTFFASVLSGILGIIMAYKGFGVYSLVGQSLSLGFFSTIFLWTTTSWRPTLYFSFNELRGLMKFSVFAFLERIINSIFLKLDVLLLAKLFNPTIIGFYTRSSTLKEQVTKYSSSSIIRVFFPMFSMTFPENGLTIIADNKKMVTTSPACVLVPSKASNT